MKLKYKMLIFVLFLLISAAYTQKASLAQEHQHKQNHAYTKTLIQSVIIDSSKLEQTNKEASAYRLLFEKKSNGDFTFIKGSKISGHSSVVHKEEYSDFAIEVWKDNSLVFQGGFNNPNLLRHEIQLPDGKWEHKDMIIEEGSLDIKVPAVSGTFEVRFFKIEDSI